MYLNYTLSVFILCLFCHYTKQQRIKYPCIVTYLQIFRMKFQKENCWANIHVHFQMLRYLYIYTCIYILFIYKTASKMFAVIQISTAMHQSTPKLLNPGKNKTRRFILIFKIMTIIHHLCYIVISNLYSSVSLGFHKNFLY